MIEMVKTITEIKFTEEERDILESAYDILSDLTETLIEKDNSRIFIPEEISIDIDELDNTKYVLMHLSDYLIPWKTE